MKAMIIIVQWMFFSPRARIKVVATTRAPPDSASILPRMVPSPTTMAMEPSTPPTPSWNPLAISPRFMPEQSPTKRDARMRATKELSLNRAMRMTNPITATKA